jgi:hypothetical protein
MFIENGSKGVIDRLSGCTGQMALNGQRFMHFSMKKEMKISYGQAFSYKGELYQ